ncbi:MAG: hypothetical protein JWN69_1593 [Alphaproteobacteria bacterium]|nr:hypothetical protein [Alphaproteobacteria bacterium]
MLTLAIAAALVAAPDSGAGSPGQLRKDYGTCLNKFVDGSVKDKLAPDAFTAGAKAACVSQERAFRKSIVDGDLRVKIKQSEAEDNANTQVEDYLANAADKYSGYVGETAKPAEAPTLAEAPK